MHEHHVFRLEVGSVRTDTETLYLWTWLHDLKHKLMLWRRRSFPRLAHAECLLLGCHFCGESGYNTRCQERICGLDDSREDIARGHDHQRNVFAVALGDAHTFGEQRLLVIAEDLFGREINLAASWSCKPGSKDYNVVLCRVGIL